MSKLKVVAVEPQIAPYVMEMTFKEIQEFVGGDVETVHLYDDKLALVNEMGQGLEQNRHMILQEKGYTPLTLVGNFVVVKKGKNDLEGLNEKEIEEALFIYRSTSADATIFI